MLLLTSVRGTPAKWPVNVKGTCWSRSARARQGQPPVTVLQGMAMAAAGCGQPCRMPETSPKISNTHDKNSFGQGIGYLGKSLSKAEAGKSWVGPNSAVSSSPA